MGYHKNQEVENQADFDAWMSRRELLPTRADSFPTRRSRRETYRKPKTTFVFTATEVALLLGGFTISVAANITWALMEAMGS